LKNQSILNANLFKQEHIDYSEKVQVMAKRLNEVLNRTQPLPA